MDNYFGIVWIDDCYYDVQEIKEKVRHIDGAFIDNKCESFILITTEESYNSVCNILKEDFESAFIGDDFKNPFITMVSSYIWDYLWNDTSIGDSGIFSSCMPYDEEEIEETTNIFIEIFKRYKFENCLDKFNWLCELDNAIAIYTKNKITKEIEKQYKEWERQEMNYKVIENSIKII